MDIYEFMQNRGTKIVPNPLYNPKSKKNKEPKNIVIADTHASDDAAVNMAVEDFKNQYTITPEEDAKYAKYRLNYSLNEDMNKLLAESQSAWKKWGNGIAQTFISEIGLGTVKAFSDVIDLIGQATGLTDDDYTNPVSKYLEEKQEEFRNFAPVYADPDINIKNGGLLDAGWWASNMPNIASSLTLLLPSLAITRGVGLLAKATKLTSYTRKGLRAVTGAEKKLKAARALRAEGASEDYIRNVAGLSKFQKTINSSSTASTAGLFIDNAANAAIMRATENYQEASQTYNDMYTQGSEYLNGLDNLEYQAFVDRNRELIESNNIDPNDRDSVAKLIAKTSADRTFQIDWLNVGWDLLQMYGLQSAWKGVRNLSTKSGKVRRADIDSKKYFGKSADEIKALKANRSRFEKTKEWLEDKTIGSAFVIGAQASEGAEEALNYIAQQEGMTLGNILLGKEDESNNIDSFWGSVLSGFDGRLSSYVSAPELWDSAFWGVLGGVVFQGAGNKARQIADKLSTSKKDKKAKENLPWYALNELPENKRLISDIEARGIDFLDYKEKLAKINDNIDVFNSTENNEIKFDTKEEQDFARNKLKKQYAHKMALRSLRNGTIDMLKAYMSNDNVRKGLVESGIFDVKNDTRTNEEKYNEATEFTNDILNEINKVEQLYDEELIAVRDINDELEDEYGNPIPIEFSQIITNTNINNKLELEDLNNELINTSSIAERIRQSLSNNNKLDNSLDYERAVEVAVITHYMGQIRAKIRQIESKKKEDRDYNDDITLNNLNKQYDSLAKDLNEAERIFATQQALKYVIGEDGKFHSEGNAQTNKEAFEYYDEMIVNGVEKGNITSAILGQYNTLVQDSNKVLSTIKSISPELNSLYQYQAALKQRIKLKKQDIATTFDEIQEQDNIISNTLNEARKKAIIQANNVITNLYKKYGKEIKDYIEDKLNNEPTSLNITESEIKTLNGAIDILDLTKSYNQGLYYKLTATFDLIDSVEVARQQNKDKEDEEEASATVGQPIQPTSQSTPTPTPTPATQPTQPTQSTQPIQPAQQAPIQPQPRPQPQPQPQPTQPIQQPTQPQQINTIINSNLEFDNTGNGASITMTYVDNENAYSLSIENEELEKNGVLVAKLFEIDNVSLLNPVIVDEEPVVRLDNNKIEVVKKGTLKQANINNQEQGGSQAAIPSTGEVGSSNTPTNNDISNTASINNTPANSSNPSPVGESRNSVPQPAPTTPVDDESKVESTVSPQTDLISEMNVYTSALSSIFSAIKGDRNVDIDTVAAAIKNDFVKKGVDTTLANAMVDKAAAAIKRRIERQKNKTENTMQSSIDEVIINQSLLNGNEVEPMTSYINSVREMMNLYAKEVGLEKINGKYYIDLEELLRFVNNSTNSKTTAKLMYNSLATYLKDEEGRKEYVLIDEDEIDNDNFLDNVEKTQEERYLEKIKDDSVHRVDIRGYVEELVVEDDKETIEDLVDNYYKSLDDLSIGDKLTIVADENRGYVYLSNSNGKTVGRLPIPSVDPRTGTFETYNDGWKYEVNSNNGIIVSPIKDLFERWLNSTTSASKELNEIIYEFAFTKLDDERKIELVNKLENNSEYKRAKALFGSNLKGTTDRINGLVKLWRFIGNANGSPSLVNNIKIKGSLNLWFQKLYNSYNAVHGIINNKDVTIEVADINEGELIRIAPDGGIEAYNKALPASEALAGGVNPDINKLAVADRGTMGIIKVSGMPAQIFAGVSPGNTLVVIPSKSGRHGYVHAYPANVTDDFIGNDAKELLSEIKKEIKRLFKAHAKEKSEKSLKELVTFLTKVFDMNNNNKTLFDGIAFTVKNNFINIGQSNTSNFVTINFRSSGNRTVATKYYVGSDDFEVNAKGYKSKSLDFDSEEGLNAISKLLDNLKFRLTYAYIDSDNVDTMNLNGIATKKNGKFIIKVGDREFVYNSFNEFILNNNLVRLNTKPNERGTSNFNRISERTNRANAKLEIRILKPSSSPVEESNQEQEQQTSTPVTPSTYTINEKVIDILNSNDSNKGKSITSLVFTEEQVKALDKLHILPKDIIFDPYFNTRKNKEKTNAEINVKTGVVTVGSKWLDMFSRPYDRNQAIRKLMHEQVHYLLHSNNANVKVIKEIYDEFKDALDNNRINNPDSHDLNHLKVYLFENYKNEDRRFEEFLVETLTSEELARALNDIDSNVTKYRGRNLFQRLLEFLSKLFNWNVREGSLYQKELYTLRNIFNNNVENNNSVESQQTTEQVAEQTVQQASQQPVEQSTEQSTEQQNEPSIEQIATPTDEEFSVDLSDELIDEFESTISEQSIDDNYTEEMQSIKNKSIADGTFMKAPNGNSTNLNERQWLQVRTKAFINWFGDWQNVNNFNIDAIDTSKVDIEEVIKPWKTDNSKSNKTIRIYIKNQHNKGYFELVKDQEFGIYSVHFKTGNADSGEIYGSTKEERTILYEQILNALPDGAQLSTWGELSEGGIKALNKFGKTLKKVGERTVKDRKGNIINIPIYQKGNGVSKVVDENGEPLVVYHGGAKVNKFNTSGKLTTGAGIQKGIKGAYFTTSLERADFYRDIAEYKLDLMSEGFKDSLDEEVKKGNVTKEEADKAFNNFITTTITKVFLNIKNPLINEYEFNIKKLYNKDGTYREVETKTATFINSNNIENYDGENIILHHKNVTFFNYRKNKYTTKEGEPEIEWVATNPNQIKSAESNTGKFNTEDDNIYQSSVDEISNTNKVKLGQQLTPNSKYGQQGETDVRRFEVLDENNNSIGDVQLEFNHKLNSVTLHPTLNITGKGYGKSLYIEISKRFNANVTESFGLINKSKAAKALWDSFDRVGLTKLMQVDDDLYVRVININESLSSTNNKTVSIIFPSLLSLQNQLPLSDRVKFNTLIDNGEFSTSCK